MAKAVCMEGTVGTLSVGDTVFNSIELLERITNKLDRNATILATLAGVNTCSRDVVKDELDKIREAVRAEHSLWAEQSIRDWINGVSQNLEFKDECRQADHINLSGLPDIEERHLKKIAEELTNLVEIRFNGELPSLEPLQGLRNLKKITISADSCRGGQVRALSALQQLSLYGCCLNNRKGHYLNNGNLGMNLENELRDMPGLRELSLDLKGLQNISFVENLVNLEKLQIRKFYAHGFLSVVSRLKKLTALSIDERSFDVFPLEKQELYDDAFASLTKLQSLCLYVNLRPSHFEQIGQMTQLLRLELNSRDTAAEIPNQIGALKNLEDLRLRDFSLDSKQSLETINRLSKLQNLWIDPCSQFIDMPELELPQLKSLTMVSRRNVGRIERLNRLENLESLHVFNLRIEEGAEVRLPKLKKLDLGSDMDENNPEFLKNWKLPELEEINVEGIANIRSLAGFSKIRRLACRDGLERFDDLLNLDELKFSCIEGRETDLFIKLNNFTQLKSLKLRGVPVEKRHVRTLNSLKGLEKLSLDSMNISADVWNKISLPKLKFLNFMNTGYCGRHSKLRFDGFPNLKRISCSKNFREFLDFSKNLQFLEYR